LSNAAASGEHSSASWRFPGFCWRSL
jgi:hypothetical protein